MRRPPSPFESPPPPVEGQGREITLVRDTDLKAASGPVRDDMLPVWIYRCGQFHPVVLTGWLQLRPQYWAARIQTGTGETVWIHHKPAGVLPIWPQAGMPPGPPELH